LPDDGIDQHCNCCACERRKQICAIRNCPHTHNSLPEFDHECIESITRWMGYTENVRDKNVFGRITGDWAGGQGEDIEHKGGEKDKNSPKPGDKVKR